MVLAKSIIALRALLIFLSVLAFGIEIYLIKLYHDHQNLVFTWRFYVLTGIIGFLTFYFIASTISFCVHRRHLKRMTNYQPKSTLHSILSIIEMLIVVGLSGALLYVTIPALIGRNRTAFLAPFNRESPQDDSVNHDYRKYDPKNLYECPEYKEGGNRENELSYLCSLDQSIIIAGCGVGAIAIISAILALIYNMSPPPQAQWANNNYGCGDYEHPEPIPLVNKQHDKQDV